MALGISDAVELSGRVVDLVKKGVTIELQERIMQLREAVLNAKEELLALREENSQLKRLAAEKEQLTFDGVVYWLHGDSEQQGPYCQKCYDADAKAIRLQRAPPTLGYSWKCTACGTRYGPRSPSGPQSFEP